MKRHGTAPVSWRDGIHLTGTSIWCDAKRSRDICFVSAASAVPHAKHGQLIASAETLSLLERPGEEAASQLAVPYGQPFTLGTQRIELFASGHAYGSASILVHAGDTKIVYAGAIRPHEPILGRALDYRSSDVLVVNAPYGQAHFAFEDAGAIAKKLVLRCNEICAEAGVAVLLVDGIGKALDVAQLLGESALPIFAHRRLQETTAALHKKSPELPAPKRWNAKGSGGRVLLWPLSLCSKLDASVLPASSRVLLVSGRAIEADSVAAAGADEGFAWSNQADHEQLLDYIRGSGARQIFLTHSVDRGADLAAKLSGRSVEAIGPPQQLSLFQTL